MFLLELQTSYLAGSTICVYGDELQLWCHGTIAKGRARWSRKNWASSISQWARVHSVIKAMHAGAGPVRTRVWISYVLSGCFCPAVEELLNLGNYCPKKYSYSFYMTLYFYNCGTTYRLLTWWEFWGGCLRSSGGLKPAETVWNVSMFLLANAANCRQNPLRFLPPPLFLQRLQNIDMIMYLGRSLCSAYIPVFMRSWACVHRSASCLEDQLVEHLSENVSFFSWGTETNESTRGLQECFVL